MGDGITDVTLPTLTGAGTDGDTVTFHDGSTVLGTGTVTGGTWSIAAGSLLLDGPHSLTATQTDPAGNVSAASTALAVNIVDGVIDVGSFAQLDAAIAAANAATAGQSYTITLTGNIAELADPTAINLSSGVSLTIDGGGNTLDGGTSWGGLFVYAGNVCVQNLAINDMRQHGASISRPAGGGAGLGGGLFEASGGTVTLSGVSFADDAATGGNGGAGFTAAAGGGFGNVVGFGTAGAAGAGSGGNGGVGSPGFGGSAASIGGGGGLGAGGDIFVQQGGSLTIEGGSVGAGAVNGGVGEGSIGDAFGSSIFLQGSQTQTLAPGAGQTLTILGDIADEAGNGGNAAHAAGLLVSGAGTVVLDGTNTVSNGITLSAGTLIVDAAGAIGNTSPAVVTFTAGSTAAFEYSSYDTLNGEIAGFGAGDTVIVTNFAYSPLDTIGFSDSTYVAITDASNVTTDVNIAGASGDSFILASANGGSATAITLAPPAPIVTETLTDDTGSSSSDGITSNPALSGSADPNAVVILTEGAPVLGTTTANGAGQWTYTPVGLPDGSHTIVASDTNASSITGTASLTLTLESATPAAPAGVALAAGSDSGTLGDGITDITAPSITGTGTTGDVVTLYQGSTALGSATVAGGTWTIAAGTLSAGSHDGGGAQDGTRCRR